MATRLVLALLAVAGVAIAVLAAVGTLDPGDGTAVRLTVAGLGAALALVAVAGLLLSRRRPAPAPLEGEQVGTASREQTPAPAAPLDGRGVFGPTRSAPVRPGAGSPGAAPPPSEAVPAARPAPAAARPPSAEVPPVAGPPGAVGPPAAAGPTTAGEVVAPAVIDLRDATPEQIRRGVASGQRALIDLLVEQGDLTGHGPITDHDVRTLVFVAVSARDLVGALLGAGALDPDRSTPAIGELFHEGPAGPAPRPEA